MADSKNKDSSRAEEIGLHNLKPKPGSTHRRKRVGRGEGSGNGKTSGRGHKGAGSRSGAKEKPGYEGGQNPIQQNLQGSAADHIHFRHIFAAKVESQKAVPAGTPEPAAGSDGFGLQTPSADGAVKGAVGGHQHPGSGRSGG